MPPERLASIEACIPSLRRYASALLRDRQDAEDLVHDCLVRALDRLHTRREEHAMRPWLFAIMHNLFISQARRARFRGHEPLDRAGGGEDAAVTGAPQEDALRWRDLMRALDRLPPEQRAVLLLVTVEDFSYAEVARVLGIPLGTTMSRLSRARERLREMMDEEARPLLRRVK
jgi:RNA polymerase sigma-70 factor, ECF subfamily